MVANIFYNVAKFQKFSNINWLQFSVWLFLWRTIFTFKKMIPWFSSRGIYNNLDGRVRHLSANLFSAVALANLKADWVLIKSILIASSAMKTRLSIDTEFKIYRAKIAWTKNSIPDDYFIVHHGDINKPDHIIPGYLNQC
jgi:hypothetical protein